MSSEILVLKDTFRPLVVQVVKLFGMLSRGVGTRVGGDGLPKTPCGAHARARVSPELCAKFRLWGGEALRYVLGLRGTTRRSRLRPARTARRARVGARLEHI